MDKICRPGPFRMTRLKYLRNDDYFAIFAFYTHSVLLTNYATGGLAGTPLN